MMRFPLCTLETIAGKCTSKKVAIRPASLWTHYTFEAIQTSQSTQHRFWLHRVRVPRRNNLCEELQLWYGLLVFTSFQGWEGEIRRFRPRGCHQSSPFHQGEGHQICPREGLFLCRPLRKRGQICDRLPHSLSDSPSHSYLGRYSEGSAWISTEP